MDMRSLKYFISAAHHLNFTKAADECFITQTAMSLCIAKLESELNFQLFYRTNHKMLLTPGGEAFLKGVKKALNEYERAVDRGRSASLGYEGILRLGFSNYLERLSIPNLLLRFHQKYPNIEIKICQNEQWIMKEELKDGEADVALIFPYDLENDTDIHIEKIASYESCLAVNVNHRFASLKKVNAEMLADETMIVMSSEVMPSLYRIMLSSFSKYGIKVKNYIETKSIASILTMVEADMGVAIVLPYIKQVSSKSLVCLDLEGYPNQIDVAFAYLASNDNPALPLFLELAREERELNTQF